MRSSILAFDPPFFPLSIAKQQQKKIFCLHREEFQFFQKQTEIVHWNIFAVELLRIKCRLFLLGMSTWKQQKWVSSSVNRKVKIFRSPRAHNVIFKTHNHQTAIGIVPKKNLMEKRRNGLRNEVESSGRVIWHSFHCCSPYHNSN